MTIISRVVGCGSYLPATILTNEELAKRVDTTDEWIQQRTGIKQRHIVADGEMTSDMATAAAQKALKNANLSAAEIDLIILATTTPDHPFPATATKVQTMLGANKAFAFDLQAVCSGFAYALATADNFIKSGSVKTALVIGADAMSKVLDWTDRSNCVLFGDGAGAFVLKADTGTSGILSTHLFSDGTCYDALYVDPVGAAINQRGFIQMKGREIYRHAVHKIGGAVETALKANNMTVDDVDWLVPHQANRRILEAVADHFTLPMEKIVITIDQHANTSAASIPLATCVAVDDGRIKPGQIIVFEAMGGGLTWGSAVVRW